MWNFTYSHNVTGLVAKPIWNQLRNVNHWTRWQSDLEYVRLYDLFRVGSKIYFKRTDWSTIQLLLTKVEDENKLSLCLNSP